MIVDTSALMAVVLGEPEGPAIEDVLARSGRKAISAGNWIELEAVLPGKIIPGLSERLDDLITAIHLEIEPVTMEQARIGRTAYRDFGRKSGSSAKLNFGACFAYALARATGEPLLFKGDDFTHTDITPALT